MAISTGEMNDIMASLEAQGVELDTSPDRLTEEEAEVKKKYEDMSAQELEDEIDKLEAEFKQVGLRLFAKNEQKAKSAERARTTDAQISGAGLDARGGSPHVNPDYKQLEGINTPDSYQDVYELQTILTRLNLAYAQYHKNFEFTTQPH